MRRHAVLLGSILACWAGAQAYADLTNGDFSTGDLTGWMSSGPVSVEAIGGTPPAAFLDEDELLLDGTDLHQTFEILPGPMGSLSLTFAMFAEGVFPEPFPPDAFLVSLLDPVTQDPLLATPGFTDFFAVEFDGVSDFFLDYDPLLVEVTDLTDLSTSDVFGVGGMVTLDITSLAAAGGGLATLDFNLAGGFDGFHSQVFIDSVSAQVIPVPASALMALVGFTSLAGFGSLRRRGRSSMNRD